MPDYTVILLTWNSRQHIDACLDSLAEAAPGRAAQVVVVDNGSSDGTTEMVQRRGPAVQLIRNPTNLGVARARNQGLAQVRAPYGVLLDVDTVVTPNALGSLLDLLDEQPGVGLCAPRLLLPDGSTQPSCQLFPTLRDKLVRQLPPQISGPLLGEVEMRDWDHRGQRDVDYVVGACQVIRMSALAEVGPLDERIFYGPEDVDFCLRLRLAGYRIVYRGDVVIHHECQRVTRHRFDRLAWLHLKGLLHYYRKHGYFWSRSGLYRRIEAAEASGPTGLAGPRNPMVSNE